MLYEIINHMDEDELRNYVKHQDEVIKASQSLNMADQELINAWRQIAISMEYQHDSLFKRNNRLDELHAVERELKQKYDEFIPKPTSSFIEF